MCLTRRLCAALLCCGCAGASADPAIPADQAGLAPGSADASDAAVLGPATLPPGSIIAFVPQASGFSGSTEALRDWLAERGWALCDGTRGTPDLRDRVLFGTTDAAAVGTRLGGFEHSHRVRGETGTAVLRNRHTQTGQGRPEHLADDQHRHSLDVATDSASHLPPSTRVLFIMKLP